MWGGGTQDAYPAHLWHRRAEQALRDKACTGKFEVGALKAVPVSTATGYNEIAKRVFISVASLDKVPAGASLFSSCFKFSQWVSLPCSRGAFHSVAFALDLRASAFVWKYIKGRSSLSYISMTLLLLIPTDIQNHIFVGLSLFLFNGTSNKKIFPLFHLKFHLKVFTLTSQF